MKRVLVTLLFLWGMKAWAQDVPNFYFTTPFYLESGRDLGIPNGNNKVNATSMVLTAPTFTLLKTSPRGDLSLGYRPEFIFFNAHNELNAWNHQAGMRWDYRLSPRMTFEMSDGFFSTNDNSRRFDSTFLLPRGRYNENLLNMALAYQLGPNTAVRLRYDNSWVKFGSQQLAAPVNFNVLTNTVGVGIGQKLGEKSRVSVSYAYLRGHSLGPQTAGGLPLPSTAPSHFVGASCDYQLRPTLLLEVSAGAVRSAATSYTVGGLVEKHFSHLVLSSGYSRYLSLLGAAQPAATASSQFGPFGPFGRFGSARDLPGNSITETAQFHAIGAVTRKLSIDFAVLASRTAGTSSSAVQALQTLVSGARLDYKLTDHFGVFADTQFFAQTATASLPIGVSRRRWFGGVRYTFSPTPEEIARRIDAIHAHDTTAGTAADTPDGKAEEKP